MFKITIFKICLTPAEGGLLSPLSLRLCHEYLHFFSPVTAHFVSFQPTDTLTWNVFDNPRSLIQGKQETLTYNKLRQLGALLPNDFQST
ncbi:hypothetical protein TNCT_124651 [Trichonephila clavata]|uniref:Uncharacterized protein n=1 Tax=Trichonephila clavata TaxID=2740835 RepID=A0A8X6LH90_TRICU|nr:hypothetical protein TNCT_124651 [Trichonephila clavata]